MSIGQGIAIAGIWIGVRLAGMTGNPAVALVALFAMIATIFATES